MNKVNLIDVRIVVDDKEHIHTVWLDNKEELNYAWKIMREYTERNILKLKNKSQN